MYTIRPKRAPKMTLLVTVFRILIILNNGENLYSQTTDVAKSQTFRSLPVVQKLEAYNSVPLYKYSFPTLCAFDRFLKNV